jgi:hypothetical protein
MKSDYGKLKKDTVYLRRGSTTDTADPDEIVRMVHASEPPAPKPKLSLIGRIEHGTEAHACWF